MSQHRPSIDYGRHAHELAMLFDPRTIQAAHLKGQISAENAVERLEHTNAEGQVAAGKIATELAMKAPDFDTASSWINRAGNNYEQATDPTGVHTEESTLIEAKLCLAQLPLIGYLAMFEKLPPNKLVEKSYEATVGVTRELSRCFQQKALHQNPDETILIGIAAESAVLLLGQRYALTSSIDEASWLPLHSLYSEDHANKSRLAYNRAWDITFFTDLGEGPEKSYCAQVKAGKQDHIQQSRKNCVARIIQIHFSPDLAFKSEKQIAALATLDEMNIELSGTNTTDQNLQARTDKLLDRLDSK